MSRRISFLLSLVGIMLIAALLPAASFADPAYPPAPPISYPAAGLNPPPNLESTHTRLAVMVGLGAPALLGAPNGTDSPSLRQRIAAAQTALAPQLSAIGARVLFQTSLVYAGIAVKIPADQL